MRFGVGLVLYLSAAAWPNALVRAQTDPPKLAPPTVSPMPAAKTVPHQLLEGLVALPSFSSFAAWCGNALTGLAESWVLSDFVPYPAGHVLFERDRETDQPVRIVLGRFIDAGTYGAIYELTTLQHPRIRLSSERRWIIKIPHALRADAEARLEAEWWAFEYIRDLRPQIQAQSIYPRDAAWEHFPILEETQLIRTDLGVRLIKEFVDGENLKQFSARWEAAGRPPGMLTELEASLRDIYRFNQAVHTASGETFSGDIRPENLALILTQDQQRRFHYRRPGILFLEYDRSIHGLNWYTRWVTEPAYIHTDFAASLRRAAR